MNWFELPAPDPALPAPAFADVDSARRWLSSQPQAMPARLQLALTEQFERLAPAALPPRERAALVETLRNPAITTQDNMRRKFAFAARPLTAEAMSTFTASVRLWDALAACYLRCVEDFAEIPCTGDVRQLLATAAHRAMVTCRLALEDHFVAGIEAPAALWPRLHRLLQVASQLGIADLPMIDPEYRDPAKSSLLEQYVLAALIALADPYRWGSAHFSVARRALSRWNGMVPLAAESNSDPKLRWVPLSTFGELPAVLGENSPAWLEVHMVRRKLRKRIESLNAGDSPETLHLGRDLNAASCRDLLASILDRLRAAYSEGRPLQVPVDTDCELAVGPAGCFQLLTNRSFSGSSHTLNAASSRILHDRIAIFGSAERVDGIEKVEAAEGEPWRLNAESVDVAVLSRAAGGNGTRMLPGQLVVFRDPRSTASLAVVTRAWTRRDGRSEIALRRLPGKPAAMTGSAVDLLNEPAFPVFFLPAVPAVASAASLLIPTGIAPRLKKGLEARSDEYVRCRLDKLIERGADFERYLYEAY